MKKFFRTLIIIILFLGVGFLYIVKNPTLPVSQKVLHNLWISTTLRPNVPTNDTTGIDLTNCVAYFDGCNNCSVRDGKPDACTLMYCETPGTPRCTQYSTGDAWSVGIANPASVNCEKNWWTLEILDWPNGQYGMCHLPNGTSCEERAYMRGQCAWTTTGAWSVPWNPWVSPGNEWTMCTMEYAPVCALIQIQCIKAPCNPIEQTFSNMCVMKQNKLAMFLHEGECMSKGNEPTSTCPQRSQPAPWYCPDGTIVDGGKDKNWCQLPPKCQKK